MLQLNMSIRGLASKPSDRVLHGQFSKNMAGLTMHDGPVLNIEQCIQSN